MNIVLVDDTPDHLELLAEFVRELRPRATVLPLQNGLELPDCLNKKPVDMVMMDLMMPTISGIDLVRRVREAGRWPNLPIVAVSGLNQVGQQQQLLEAGFTDHIVKPYEIDELVRVLNAHLPEEEENRAYRVEPS
ncbi:MAG: response regulator [Chloroflexota bacterium]|nr:response regulator [Chloroflexota bacterium]